MRQACRRCSCPASPLAGYRGAVATMVLFAMVGAWLAWRVSWEVTRDARASWVGMLATVGAAPFFLHGAAIFPDAPASVLTLFAVWVLLRDASAVAAARRAGSAASPRLRAMAVLCRSRSGCCRGCTRGTRFCRSGSARRLVADAGRRAATGARWPRSSRQRRCWPSAWFGFFFAVYGTPSPSAPYGAYTQMALAHLRPGLPGLAVRSAVRPAGECAGAGSRARVAAAGRARRRVPRIWRLALLGDRARRWPTRASSRAYRMWWGGLSAPARFLVPLVLPLAPFIALGWQSLRTRASRHLAVGAAASCRWR